jgi:putative ATPase
MQLPLAEKLRPSVFEDIVGFSDLFKEKAWIKSSIEKKRPYSLLLYGPPGCGKTTFGRIYAKSFGKPFFLKSAVSTSVSEIKKILDERKKSPLFSPYILFVDELHRYNRAQQDLFLPFIEDCSLVLIGATTENPSFSINNALLSRIRLINFKSLEDKGLEEILDRYEKKYQKLNLTDKVKKELFSAAGGDGRYFLNLIELLEGEDHPIDDARLFSILEKKAPLYAKKGDGHYQLISCFHKAIRGSDPDSALYWLARMLSGGEDPLFIGRRLIRMASEDIGLAAPGALTFCLSAFKTYQILGSPEGELALAEAALYLALSPKSNRTYTAFNKAWQKAEKTAHLSPPAHLVNPVGKASEESGHGKGYIYDHDVPLAYSGQSFLPEQLSDGSFYEPKEIGYERDLKKRMEFFKNLKNKIRTEK